jgi:hypothetical protein
MHTWITISRVLLLGVVLGLVFGSEEYGDLGVVSSPDPLAFTAHFHGKTERIMLYAPSHIANPVSGLIEVAQMKFRDRALQRILTRKGEAITTNEELLKHVRSLEIGECCHQNLQWFFLVFFFFCSTRARVLPIITDFTVY